MTEHNNTKLRAVFLAALMILWVFAGTMAFAGSAAATDGSGTFSIENSDVSPSTEKTLATYTFDAEVNNGTSGPHENLSEVEIDFDGADVSNANNINVSFKAGGHNNTTSVTRSGDVLTVDIGDQNFSAADVSEKLNITVENVETPASGSQDIDITVRDFNGTTIDQTRTTSIQIADADQTWETDSRRWQGQDLVFIPNSTSNDYALYTWDNGSNPPAVDFVRELSFSNGQAVIETSSLEGDYVILNESESNPESNGHVFTNADGEERRSKNNDDIAESPKVEIAVQDLERVEFAEEDVNLNGFEDLEIESNRNGFSINISSEELTQAELDEMFDHSGNSNTVTRVGDDVIQVDGIGSDDSLNASFDEDIVEEGTTYNFDIDVADTTASGSANITVDPETEGGVDFEEAKISETRGDLVWINMTTTDLDDDDEFNLTITDGSSDGYETNLSVSPNDDGELFIEMNLWNASKTGMTASDVYRAEEGSVNTTAGNPVTNEDVAAGGRVLDAGLYDVIAEEQNFAEEPEEFDITTLEITERTDPEISVHTAPNSEVSSFSNGDMEEINEQMADGTLTASSAIAIADSDRGSNRRGDGIIYKVEVDGVFGALEGASGNDAQKFTQLNASNDDLLRWFVNESETGPNTDGLEARFDDDEQVAVINEKNKSIYLVYDSDDLDGLETGSTLEARLNFTQTFLNNFTSGSVEDPETVSTEHDAVDREAEFDTTNDLVQVQAASNQTISGTTTVAPGTEVRVRARATGDGAFLRSVETEVQEDGTFEATYTDGESFDGIQVGTNFTVSIPRQSFDDDAETDGRVVEQVSTPTPTPDTGTPTATEPPETPTATEPPETATATTTDDGQPGFGAIVALIALLGAALLAARRNAF